MLRLAVDIETQPSGNRPDPWRDRLLLTGCLTNEGEFYQWKGLDVPDWFLRALEDPGVEVIFHYAQFDTKFLKHYFGLNQIRNITCTHAQERLLTSGLGVSNSLEAVAQRRLGVTLDKGVRDKLQYGVIDQEVLDYHCQDIEVLFPIADQQAIEIKRNGQEYAAQQENELTGIVGQMEYIGIGFDQELWSRYQEEIARLEGQYAAEVWRFLGLPYSIDFLTSIPTCRVSLGSREQVLRMLAERDIRLPNYQAATLRNFVMSSKDEKKQQVVQNLLLWKQWNKALGWSYHRSLNPVTQRLHCSFHPQGTDTSRFSCSEENLQNVTKPYYGTEINFRHLFRALPLGEIPVRNARRDKVVLSRGGERRFVGADYSQIELRLLALFTREPSLVQAFKDGEDLHLAAAETILGRKPSKKDRNYGKIVNFGVRAYGGGPRALIASALDYGILLSKKEALQYVDAIRRANPLTEQWGNRMQQEMVQRGYLQTKLGHRRWLLDDDRETVARNTPIQTTASEILKEGIRILCRRLRDRFSDAYLVLQVHDEVGVDCAAKDAKEVEAVVHDSLVQGGQRFMEDIPCKVETYVSTSWEK